MRIKNFNQLNENNEESKTIEYSKEELKAIKAGWNIGDYVYNHKMGKKQRIVKLARTVLDDKEDKYCTLGAVGQWPNNFTKAPAPKTNLNDHPYTKYSLELKIKKPISEMLQFGHMTKDELKEMLEKYIDSI